MMLKIIIWPGAIRWDEDAICAGRFWNASLHAQCVYLCVFVWSYLNSLQGFGFRCGLGVYVYGLSIHQNSPPPFSLPLLISPSLPPSHRQRFSWLLHFLSFLPHQPSLYPSIPLSVGGMRWPSVVQRELERDWGGERESDMGGEKASEQCCDIVISVKVEVKWTEGKRREICAMIVSPQSKVKRD